MPDLMAAMLAAENRPAPRPAPTPPGCRRRPRRRCTRRTITRSMSPRGSSSWRRGPRASLDDILTIPVARGVELVARGGAAGTRQQRAGHPRLCGALDRPGRRLLEGPGHQRCRADGGSRDVAHFQPAHRQLAAARHRHRAPGDGDAASAWRRSSTSRMPAIRPICRWRRISTRRSRSQRRAIWCSKAAASRTAIPSRSCMRAASSISGANGIRVAARSCDALHCQRYRACRSTVVLVPMRVEIFGKPFVRALAADARKDA